MLNIAGSGSSCASAKTFSWVCARRRQRPDGDTVSGTINMLCSDRYTDIGEGAAYQSTGSILPLGRTACVDERAGLPVLVIVVVMVVPFVEVAFVNLSADLARP
jgi:hypothetical protein